MADSFFKFDSDDEDDEDVGVDNGWSHGSGKTKPLSNDYVYVRDHYDETVISKIEIVDDEDETALKSDDIVIKSGIGSKAISIVDKADKDFIQREYGIDSEAISLTDKTELSDSINTEYGIEKETISNTRGSDSEHKMDDKALQYFSSLAQPPDFLVKTEKEDDIEDDQSDVNSNLATSVHRLESDEEDSNSLRETVKIDYDSHDDSPSVKDENITGNSLDSSQSNNVCFNKSDCDENPMRDDNVTHPVNYLPLPFTGVNKNEPQDSQNKYSFSCTPPQHHDDVDTKLSPSPAYFDCETPDIQQDKDEIPGKGRRTNKKNDTLKLRILKQRIAKHLYKPDLKIRLELLQERAYTCMVKKDELPSDGCRTSYWGPGVDYKWPLFQQVVKELHPQYDCRFSFLLEFFNFLFLLLSLFLNNSQSSHLLNAKGARHVIRHSKLYF